MRRVIYTRKGQPILVDAADYEALAAHTWCLNASGYAIRKRRIQGEQVTIFMHRELLGMQKGDGQYADHINLQRTDNGQNQCNRALRPTSGSGIKGVFKKADGKWMPYIDADGARTYLGTFADPQAAAECRRIAAEALHGAFARHT